MKSQNQLEDVALWRSLVTWARVASVEGMVGMNVGLIGMGFFEEFCFKKSKGYIAGIAG